MMNNLALDFFVHWTEDKPYTWSGIPWNLISELGKHVEVRDYDLRQAFQDKVRRRVKEQLNHWIDVERFMINDILSYEKFIDKNYVLDDPMLVFNEIRTQNIENTYIYSDLSVDFLSRLKADKQDLLKYSPLSPKVPWRIVNKRREMALDFLENCGGIFTMSQWLADDLVENTNILPGKVHVVGAGINLDVSKIDRSKKTRRKFLFVAEDFEQNAGYLVLEAFKILRDKHKDQVELHIAGPHTMPKDLDIPDGVVYYGALNYDRLVMLYNACDVFVMPSFFEGYSIAFAQALTFGLPCIGRNQFSMKEMIEHGVTGFLIKYDDPSSLASYMYQALNDDAYTENVINNYDKYAERYSWERVVDEMIKVIDRDQSKGMQTSYASKRALSNV